MPIYIDFEQVASREACQARPLFFGLHLVEHNVVHMCVCVPLDTHHIVSVHNVVHMCVYTQCGAHV